MPDGDVNVASEPTSIGPYEIVSHLGTGGMADVYLGCDTSGHRVALKCLRPAACADLPGLQQRFRRERELLSQTSHQNIVATVDCVIEDDRQVLVMEYVEGTNLRALLECNAQVSPKRTAEIVAEICSAVSFLHERGIVHRDLKPENVLVDDEGRIKVADFGIASLIEEIGALTMSGQVLGSADYLAPEQRHRLPVDERVDQYSIAVMAYELLTGVKPLGLFKPPSAMRAGLDPRIDQVVLRGLQRDPADRFECVKDFADSFQTAVSGSNSRRWRRATAVGLILPVLVLAWTVGSVRFGPGFARSWLSGTNSTPLTVRLDSSPEAVSPTRVRKIQADYARSVGLPVDITDSTGMRLVLVPPGDFLAGATELEWSLNPKDRLRQRPVTIDAGIYVGIHEVTRGQFERFVESEGFKTDAELGQGYSAVTRGRKEANQSSNWRDPGYEQTDNHPVVHVSWSDARSFCEWLTSVEGVTYRLPAEIEWEYACRAATNTPWSFGDDLSDLPMFSHAAPPRGTENTPLAVGAPRMKNALGLFDMHGNVGEFVADACSPADYHASAPEPSDGDRVVVRGGMCNAPPWNVTSAYRSSRSQHYNSFQFGFRVVRELADARSHRSRRTD